MALWGDGRKEFPYPTKGYKKSAKQTEKLTRKLVRLLKYDEKNLCPLLPFIDLPLGPIWLSKYRHSGILVYKSQ